MNPPAAPPLAVTRHAAYDQVASTDAAGLYTVLGQALESLSGQPAGSGLPFPLLPAPAPGYRVPPAVGDRLLAATRPHLGVHVIDRRGTPAAAVDSGRVAAQAPHFRSAARAAAGVPRGLLTCPLPADRPPLAAVLARACGPVGGVVLARDGPQAEDVAMFLAGYGVPAAVIRRPGVRADRRCPRPPGRAGGGAGAWAVVPAGHPA